MKAKGRILLVRFYELSGPAGLAKKSAWIGGADTSGPAVCRGLSEHDGPQLTLTTLWHLEQLPVTIMLVHGLQ